MEKLDMKKFNVNSKEALAWAAGFFYNKAHITIEYKNCFIGIVTVRHRNSGILNLVREVAAAHGIEVSEPFYNSATNSYQLCFNASKGSELLQLFMAYPMDEKHKKRTEIYLRMYPLGERRTVHRDKRKEIFAEWLRLRIAEAEERNTLAEKRGVRRVGRPRKVDKLADSPPEVVKEQLYDDDQWAQEYDGTEPLRLAAR